MSKKISNLWPDAKDGFKDRANDEKNDRKDVSAAESKRISAERGQGGIGRFTARYRQRGAKRRRAENLIRGGGRCARDDDRRSGWGDAPDHHPGNEEDHEENAGKETGDDRQAKGGLSAERRLLFAQVNSLD
jgi:hypothetical protein